MTIRELQQVSKRERDNAGRAYIAQRASQVRRIIARESDDEIRAALRGAVNS